MREGACPTYCPWWSSDTVNVTGQHQAGVSEYLLGACQRAVETTVSMSDALW